MNEELKPCPFCGGNKVVLTTFVNEFCINIYQVICCNCNCCGALKRSGEKAIEMWNRRASE